MVDVLEDREDNHQYDKKGMSFEYEGDLILLEYIITSVETNRHEIANNVGQQEESGGGKRWVSLR